MYTITHRRFDRHIAHSALIRYGSAALGTLMASIQDVNNLSLQDCFLAVTLDPAIHWTQPAPRARRCARPDVGSCRCTRDATAGARFGYRVRVGRRACDAHPGCRMPRVG